MALRKYCVMSILSSSALHNEFRVSVSQNLYYEDVKREPDFLRGRMPGMEELRLNADSITRNENKCLMRTGDTIYVAGSNTGPLAVFSSEMRVLYLDEEKLFEHLSGEEKDLYGEELFPLFKSSGPI